MGKVNHEDGYAPEPKVDSAISAFVQHHHGSGLEVESEIDRYDDVP
jgi:hypothetical protein